MLFLNILKDSSTNMIIMAQRTDYPPMFDYPYGNNKFDKIRGDLFKKNIKPKKIHYEYFLALERRELKINFPDKTHKPRQREILSGAFSQMNKSQLKEKVNQLLHAQHDEYLYHEFSDEIEEEMKWFNIEK